MIKIFFIGIVLFFHSPSSALAFNTCLNFHSSSDDTSSFFKEECIKTIRELSPSVQAKTEQGNEYNLYALKKGKEWTYLILDNTGYYTIKQVKGKEEVSENDQAYTDMIVMMVKAKLINKISKPKNVAGMTFACFYKFKPKAKTMYKQYGSLQRKVKLAKTEVKQAMGILKMFKKK